MYRWLPPVQRTRSVASLVRRHVVAALLVACSTLPLLVPACVAPDGGSAPIDADLVGPLMLDVCERHDHYVMADDALTQVEKETFFRSSEILRRAIAEARAAGTPPER